MQPEFSIISVVLNDSVGLRRTLESLAAQTCRDFEHLVIDGGSQDGTVALLEKYAADRLRWISEADQGLYDAMNKGVAMARGKWVLFLNAGDCLYAEDVLEKLSASELDGDIVCGGCAYDYNGREIIARTLPAKEVWKGMPTPHQAMLFRRGILGAAPYRLQYRIAADHELVARLYEQGASFSSVPFIIARMEPLGISRTARVAVYLEKKDIACLHHRAFRVSKLKIAAYYWNKAAQEIVKAPLRRLWERHLLKRHDAHGGPSS